MALSFSKPFVSPKTIRLVWALHDPHKPQSGDREVLSGYRRERGEARRVRMPVVTAAYEL